MHETWTNDLSDKTGCENDFCELRNDPYMPNQRGYYDLAGQRQGRWLVIKGDRVEF